ncbi:hypothetical protein MtrunA17_Chr6g0486331 [Medicago truncatula]|uniref:Uncharacterized protein n=1 Tax=Medicago truncatula TaxID=3880 RepID=A0A396HQ62_MEDTR|nr:hypothetical protein MtrunA17_Chr6g0486331 [Medicago truncatula]
MKIFYKFLHSSPSKKSEYLPSFSLPLTCPPILFLSNFIKPTLSFKQFNIMVLIPSISLCKLEFNLFPSLFLI